MNISTLKRISHFFLGGVPYVRHLEAISQAKRLWINTNQKEAKQTIGAKWTQLIPLPSGRTRLYRKTCRWSAGAAGDAGADQAN